MHFTYCPECGEKLGQREAGDDGFVPYCEKCQKYRFDMFDSCIIVLVANEFGEVALIRQGYLSDRYYGFVAGYMKPGETAEETAAREVEEELGFPVDHLVAHGTTWFEPGEQLMHAFITHVKKDDFKLSDEIDDAMWVKAEEAEQYLFPARPGSAARPLLHAYLEERKSADGEE